MGGGPFAVKDMRPSHPWVFAVILIGGGYQELPIGDLRNHGCCCGMCCSGMGVLHCVRNGGLIKTRQTRHSGEGRRPELFENSGFPVKHGMTE